MLKLKALILALCILAIVLILQVNGGIKDHNRAMCAMWGQTGSCTLADSLGYALECRDLPWIQSHPSP